MDISLMKKLREMVYSGDWVGIQVVFPLFDKHGDIKKITFDIKKDRFVSTKKKDMMIKKYINEDYEVEINESDDESCSFRMEK